MSAWVKVIFALVFQASYALSQPSTCGTQWPSGTSSAYLSSPRKNGVGGFTSSPPTDHFDMLRYPSNTDCQYEVNGPVGTGIKLRWKNFDVTGDMPDCSTDYVEVFIGCSRTSIGRFCSSNIKGIMEKTFDIYSPDNCLRIKFHSSNKNSTGKGFRALISTFSVTTRMRPYECTTSSYGKRKNAYYNTFSSPYWPDRYPVKSSSCYFKLDIGHGYRAKLVVMDFDLYKSSSCDKTKMKIKGGGSSYSKAHSTIMESRCGSKKPFTLTLKDDKVFVRFKPGENYGNRGFVAGFVVYKLGSASQEGSTGRWPTYIIAVIIILIVIGVVVFCIYKRRRGQQRANQGAVAYQATPQQPVPAQGYIPPPKYGQPAGKGYPQPYPQQGIPPPQALPYQEKQGPYPPPQGYPPPGPQPYPAPDGQPYPPPGSQPYPPSGGPPPPGGQPYPPVGQPYPPPSGPPYPAPAGQPYPPPGAPPGPAPPYPP